MIKNYNQGKNQENNLESHQEIIQDQENQFFHKKYEYFI